MKMATAVGIATLVFGALAVGLAGYGIGWHQGELKYQTQLEADRAQVEQMAQSAREKEHEQQQQVAEALADRDAALAMVDSLRAQLDSVQLESSELSNRLESLSRASSSAGNCDPKRLGRCEKLLSGCTGLLGRGLKLVETGTGLSAKIAADKDVVVKALDASSK